MKNCDSFWFSIAFITKSGLIVLKDVLQELSDRKIQGKILTTDYLEFNEPGALRELLQFENLEVKVFTREHFHTKGYMFRKKEEYTFIIGSSNLTQSALKANKEWNLRVSSLQRGELIQETNEEFEYMWEQAEILTEQWIAEYEVIYKEKKKRNNELKVKRIKTYTLLPNLMQKEAVKALEKLRQEKKTRALLISATGTGKTYLSAFDVRNFKPKRMLFLVHREQILKQALESYKDVIGNEINAGLLSGEHKDFDADYLFSTVQTMAKEAILQKFDCMHFEYICIDETNEDIIRQPYSVRIHKRPEKRQSEG
ncbi:HKD family nuclease [Anaeromicropila populeti]|uniref:HKD family nuclease n=1 Tax=Anaeromicropila populeti TaxID=37658 RepID=A0A1I6J8V5_9FIRM|nr:DEAD/DEAH box helicase family protein [Anaeromicropila populeti]SFR75416.1 HKD family nuclease [Anaeromicropila populeti]